MTGERPVLELDGTTFDDFEGFVEAFSELLPGHRCNGSLDAFSDILGGGFDLPDAFVLRWRHADRSRTALGHPATVLHLEDVLAHCHPTNRPAVQDRLDAARRGEGETLFDVLVAIVREHQPGADPGHGVELELL